MEGRLRSPAGNAYLDNMTSSHMGCSHCIAGSSALHQLVPTVRKSIPHFEHKHVPQSLAVMLSDSIRPTKMGCAGQCCRQLLSCRHRFLTGEGTVLTGEGTDTCSLLYRCTSLLSECRQSIASAKWERQQGSCYPFVLVTDTEEKKS